MSLKFKFIKSSVNIIWKAYDSYHNDNSLSALLQIIEIHLSGSAEQEYM